MHSTSIRHSTTATFPHRFHGTCFWLKGFTWVPWDPVSYGALRHATDIPLRVFGRGVPQAAQAPSLWDSETGCSQNSWQWRLAARLEPTVLQTNMHSAIQPPRKARGCIEVAVCLAHAWAGGAPVRSAGIRPRSGVQRQRRKSVRDLLGKVAVHQGVPSTYRCVRQPSHGCATVGPDGRAPATRT
jgi:hypothetical protein